MLVNGIIEPSCSVCASSCVLVDKPDALIRFCTDYQKVNQITTYVYPIPRMDDCIDKYIMKCDLLKGYWVVPLFEPAKAISAFVTPEVSFQYCIMPFVLKNSQATFVRMMDQCLRGIKGVDTYVDNIVIYNDTWKEHMAMIKEAFVKLQQANLIVNLAKSEFGKDTVKYLEHTLRYGKVSPQEAKISKIVNYPEPKI